MRKNAFGTIGRAGLWAAGIAIAWGATAMATPFDDRAKETIQFYANRDPDMTGSPKFIFFYAEARFRDFETTGNTTQRTKARSYVNWGLANLTNSNNTDPSFSLWRAVDCYLRYSNYYSSDMKTLTRQKLLGNQTYGQYGTENQKMMMATARFLVSENWPGQDAATGKYSSSDPTGRGALMEMMLRCSDQGEPEHNSPTYFAMHYGAFRTLADFAKDPVIKNRAGIIAEWLLVSAAGEWMNGLWCAATERAYNYSNFRPQNSYGAATSTLRLLFGGPKPTNWGHPELIDCVQSACSTYRVPDIISQIAGDKGRTAPFVHRETHRRKGNNGIEFYLTSAIHGDYALYSQHEYFPNGWNDGGGMDMVMRWGVNFIRNSGFATFFVQHYSGQKTPLMGSTEYEQVLQSGNITLPYNRTTGGKALVGVWNKPTTDVVTYNDLGNAFHSTNPILGWIPANPSAKINDAAGKGRIYLHYNNVMIALHISKKFTWDGNGNDSLSSPAFSIPDDPNDSRIGMVVELASPSHYPGGYPAAQLAAFKTAFEANIRANLTIMRSSAAGKRITLTYRALDGTSLQTKLDLNAEGTHVVSTKSNRDFINGSTVVYQQDTWPLLHNPWVYQGFNDNRLFLATDWRMRQYFFTDDATSMWTVQDGHL